MPGMVCVKYNGVSYCLNLETNKFEIFMHTQVDTKDCPIEVVCDLLALAGKEVSTEKMQELFAAVGKEVSVGK